jgi:hypothetical protein
MRLKTALLAQVCTLQRTHNCNNSNSGLTSVGTVVSLSHLHQVSSKGNIVPFYTLKAYSGSRCVATLIPNLGHFMPGERTHQIGDWVAPRTALGLSEMLKTLCSCWILYPGLSN